jgi:hypothetical protein
VVHNILSGAFDIDRREILAGGGIFFLADIALEGISTVYPFKIWVYVGLAFFASDWNRLAKINNLNLLFTIANIRKRLNHRPKRHLHLIHHLLLLMDGINTRPHKSWPGIFSRHRYKLRITSRRFFP